MQKWILSGLIAVACAMGVYLMATGLPDKPINEAADLEEGQELLSIVATNFEFDKKEYVVQSGVNYKVKFSNKLGVHGIAVNGLDLELDNNNPQTEFTFDTPGTYEIVCSIMCGQGHSSMVSTIVVQ